MAGAYHEDSNQTSITNGTTANTDDSLSQSGAAYIFKRTGSTWAQEAYLKASNAGSGDIFGATCDISGNKVIIGAQYEDSNQSTVTNGSTASSDNSSIDAGAAYIFSRTGTTWTQIAYLKPPNIDAHDTFSATVSISGNTVVVGSASEASNITSIINGTTASSDNSVSASGAAYIFKTN